MGNSNNKLLAALLTGAAIGGALGILFAPDKGSETRKKIADKGQDLTDAVKEKIGALKDKFKKEVEAVTEQASNLGENGKAAIDKIKLS